MRKPTQSDIETAQRGLRMVGMSVADLRELANDHENKEMFASKVIALGARQMIAAKRRAGARENPRGRKLKVELRQEGGYWSVYVNGQRTVDRESFSVADRIKSELERPTTRHTEAGEVAESIRRHFAKNPHRRIRSTRRRPVLGQKRLRGRHRESENRYPYGWPGTGAYHRVQVKRGASWITLASFPMGNHGKASASDYGRALARRYPRQQFRVFWPDTQLKRNPTIPLDSVPADVRKLTRTHTVYGVFDVNGNFLDYGFDRRYASKKARQHGPGAYAWKIPPSAWKRNPSRLRKNPAPRVRADGAEVERAARLFTAFTGHPVTKMRQVSLPRVQVGLAVGPVLEIAYETTRDGKRENYLHKFRRGARPLLAASQDGRTLMLLGGGHRFTPRGIVDTPRR